MEVLSAQTPKSERRVLDCFRAFVRSGRLAHAYLFVGPPGTGKMAAALAVAKMVNCDETGGEGYCGKCPSCRKIEKGGHPDVHVIADEEAASIKIERVRAVNAVVQLKAYEARTKTVIVKDIDKLTPEAANAFLKTLEEPAADTLFLLTTSSLAKNLETICSRCQIMRFPPLVPNEIRERLLSKDPGEGQAARFLSRYSEGCWGEAQRLSRAKFFKEKNRIIDALVLGGCDGAAFKKLLSDKEKVKSSLQVLLTWFRDVILVKADTGEKHLVHGDRLQDLKGEAGRFSFSELYQLIADIVETKKMLDENLNVKLPMTLLKDRMHRL